MSARLSVITTVFNREKYLSECVESVLHSSFSDFEYIIVDDCSTDNSYQIALNFANQDNRIKLYKNSTNLGEFGNRNLAASYAKGEFIKFVDSDDLIYWYTLEVMVKAMQKYPQAAFGLSHYSIDPPKPQPFLLSSKEAYGEHYLKRGFLHYGPSLSIIRREVFEELGGFETKPLISDMAFWLKLGKHQSAVCLPPGLVWWRRHEDQEYAQVLDFVIPMIDQFKLNLAMLIEDDCPLGNDRDRAIKRLKHSYARKIWSRLFRGKYKDAITLINKGDLNLFEIFTGLRPYT